MSHGQWKMGNGLAPLSATQLLELWEQGQQASPLQQALLLLTAACPAYTAEQLAHLPIGQRDALLIQLRAWTFGPQLVSVVNCPRCAERLEFTLESNTLLLAPPTDGGEPPDTFSLQADGYAVTFRLPTSVDLAAIALLADTATAQQQVLARCLLTAHTGVELGSKAGETEMDAPGSPVPLEQLPPPVLAAVQERMAAADPQADLQVALTCPACAEEWNAFFDIVTFFWRELDDWARRTLREVHLLAGAYGWREGEILALSAWRRRAYLELVGA